MRISTEILSAAALVGEERAVELVGKAGFDGWDFSMFELSRTGPDQYLWHKEGTTSHEMLRLARHLKQIGLDNGIVCNQAHGPFPTHLPSIQDSLKLAIECAVEAGAEICVIHPMNHFGPEDNARLYTGLLPFAKEHGVKIATENMWHWREGEPTSCFAACCNIESFLAHLRAVNDPSLVACLDIGHAEMRGSGDGAANMIRALGPHLQALHIHDGDGLHDCHQIPLSMNIDFMEVITALRDVHYSGWITLEAYMYLTAFTKETVLDGLKNLAQSARKLADMLE